MGNYGSPLMLDLKLVTQRPNLLSCQNTSMDLGYLDCGEYASSLLLEHHRTLHHHLLLIHSLQGLPPCQWSRRPLEGS